MRTPSIELSISGNDEGELERQVLQCARDVASAPHSGNVEALRLAVTAMEKGVRVDPWVLLADIKAHLMHAGQMVPEDANVVILAIADAEGRR